MDHAAMSSQPADKSAINIGALLNAFVEHDGSDLFLTYNHPPAIRIKNEIMQLGERRLDDDDLTTIMEQLLDEDQIDEFEVNLELNVAKYWENRVRIRINVFRQQQHNALALRRIETNIPSLETLALPQVYEELIMSQRGLVLVVGRTGCGKSTSLAAMIGHRNKHGNGHIVTIEDPIEFIHDHDQCIISQRDVGLDTYSLTLALKNALRQTPDVILIGEVRDRETIESAIAFAETGHLCVSTLHSNNAVQALERILNFFPVEVHKQVLANLSFNLRGIVSQRLVSAIDGSRVPAIEIMLNEGVVRDYIHNGDIHLIRDVMEQPGEERMQTFDQSLLRLYRDNIITRETALREADSASNLRLRMKQTDDIDQFSTASATAKSSANSHKTATDF